MRNVSSQHLDFRVSTEPKEVWCRGTWVRIITGSQGNPVCARCLADLTERLAA